MILKLKMGLILKFKNSKKLKILYIVLTPIKQECSFKFRLLIKRLIYSLKLSVYPYSIFGFGLFSAPNINFAKVISEIAQSSIFIC